MTKKGNRRISHLLLKQNEKLIAISCYFPIYILDFRHQKGVTDRNRGERLEVFIIGSCCVSSVNIG